MGLCVFTITFIVPCLCTFWHAIHTSLFISNDFSFLYTIRRISSLYSPCLLANTHVYRLLWSICWLLSGSITNYHIIAAGFLNCEGMMDGVWHICEFSSSFLTSSLNLHSFAGHVGEPDCLCMCDNSK